MITFDRTEEDAPRPRGGDSPAGGDVARSFEPMMLIGTSPAMRQVIDLIGRVAPSNASVLLTGESGTGKSLAARLLHRQSRRFSHPLLTVDAGETPDTLLERELFGYARDAFRGARRDHDGVYALADRGTLFLDEVSNLPPGLQPKLLRALESGEFTPLGSCLARRANVRILAATNADLVGAVKAGQFHSELLKRLQTIHIHLPPLRDRRDDIPELAAWLVDQYAQHHEARVTGFDAEALAALVAHPWPGNVRELRRVVECGVLAATRPLISNDDLSLRSNGDRSPRLEDLSLADAQRILIRQALLRFNGRITPAAKALGVSRPALMRLRDRYGLRSVPPFPPTRRAPAAPVDRINLREAPLTAFAKATARRAGALRRRKGCATQH